MVDGEPGGRTDCANSVWQTLHYAVLLQLAAYAVLPRLLRFGMPLGVVLPLLACATAAAEGWAFGELAAFMASPDWPLKPFLSVSLLGLVLYLYASPHAGARA